MRGAYPPAIFKGDGTQTLKAKIQLLNESTLLSGSVDPSSVATTGKPGSLYLNSSTGVLYVKQDSGSSTNWTSVPLSTAVSALGGKYVRTTRFISIGAGTSGTVTLPSNSSVVLDDFGGTVDAVVTQMSGGKPTQSPAITAAGAVVATTFDTSGNWVFSGTPVAYPVGIVYRVKQTFTNFDDTATDIWGETGIFAQKDGALRITVDGGGVAITTGIKGYLSVPYDCTIESWELLADQSGSIVFDVWKDTYANYPPTVADTVTASAKPTLSSVAKNNNSTLTGWTRAITAGDVLGFNVDSITTVTRVTLTLKVSKL